MTADHNPAGHPTQFSPRKYYDIRPPWKIVVANDGITHINVDSNAAKTGVGRMLSDYPRSPFVHPYYGRFTSMIGYWYYMRNGRQGHELRNLSSWRAKERGIKQAPEFYELFQEDVACGQYQKIIQNPWLLNEVIKSTLPFDTYYILNGGIEGIRPSGHDWNLHGLEEIRAALQTGKVPDVWLRAVDRLEPQKEKLEDEMAREQRIQQEDRAIAQELENKRLAESAKEKPGDEQNVR
jgi:hypothetical protein